MKKLLLLCLCVVASQLSIAQTPINPNDFDVILFQKVLLQKVNAYRAENGKTKLTNNLSLGKAAQDHSDYLKTRKGLSHNQPTPGKRTVQERVLNYAKPSNFAVGENIAQTFVLVNAYNYQRDGSTKASVAKTYEEAADYMLNSWIQSSSHNENLLSDMYTLSGMATHFDRTTNKLTVVHVFARFH